MPMVLIKILLHNLKGVSENSDSFAFVGPSSKGKSPQIDYNWLLPDVFVRFCVGSSQIISSAFSIASPPPALKKIARSQD